MPVETADEGWRTKLGRDDPLVGRIWSAAADGFVGEAALLDALARERFVLLGEKHDHPDHHRLQARVIDGLVARGRAPAVVFEPPPEEREPAREAARRAGLAVVAGDLEPGERDALRESGLAGLAGALRARAESVTLGPDERAALGEQIREGHCGYAPEGMIDAMLDVQRARDAKLALSASDAAAGADGAVLICGAEHARLDRGVPRYLAGEPAASVAFAEVIDGAPGLRAHLEARWGGRPPFDFVWFTPRLDDEDPCEKFRESLEKIR